MKRQRVGYTPQNWDSIPDEPEESAGPELQVGDLVVPRISMLAKPWKEKSSIYICYEDYHPESAEPTVCGYAQGTYMGPRRVMVQSKTKTGAHWSATRKIEKMSVLHHMFLFGSMQYSIPLENVCLLADIYDDAEEE